MLLKDIAIGDGSIIGAASVVAKSIPATAIAVGNPARAVKVGVSWCDRTNLITEDEMQELDRLEITQLLDV